MPVKFSDLKGPKALPLIGNIHQIEGTRLHQQIEEWSKEYGPVFKFKLGPAKITTITDPEIINEILKRRPHDFMRQSKMGKILNEAGANGVFTAEGEEWRIQRRIVAKGLDVAHQKNYFPSILKSLDRLYTKWSKQAENNQLIDVQDDMMRFTVDVTTSLAFGVDMNTIEQEGGVIQEHMEKIFPMVYKRINDPIPWYKIVKSKKDKEFNESVKALIQYVNELIDLGKNRIKENPSLRENPENFLEAIIVAAEEEENITNEIIIGNLLTLLMAGEDTTALTLSWAVHLLCSHPEIQQELAEEANSIFGDKARISKYEDHSKLEFAKAVADETMRLKPVAPFLLFEPAEDLNIKGFEFKKGSRLLTQSRVGAIDSENFSNPSAFDPHRWITNKSKCPYHNTDSYMPFGGGPRTCPGINLALLEMKLVLSMLYKNFSVELATEEPVYEIMAFTMKPSSFKVKLSNRQ